MLHVQQVRSDPIDQKHLNPAAQQTNLNPAIQKPDFKPVIQKGFWESHQFKIVTAIGIGIIAALGIAHLESARRFHERMNNLTMKCDYMKCKPNDQGTITFFSDFHCFHLCPPIEIAIRMKFPIGRFKPSDYNKEAHRVCNQEIDFNTSDKQVNKENVVNFCKRIKEKFEINENRKGYYQKFLEAFHLV